MNTMVADALVGRTVDRRYRVDALLAIGGMATVYRAEDLRLDRPVALKVMKPGLAEDEEFVTRFRTEAKAAARLSHPHVVAVYDQGEADGLVYLAMEYVSGRTLREILRESGALPPEQALQVLDSVLQGLAAAHGAGFVHRDIKPENVLVADNGVVKVTDFGLARALATPSSVTRGVLIGTAAYLAPEQVREGVADERSDVYQAGVLLFELLTGQPPHSGESPWAVAYQHVNTDVPRASAIRPGLDPEVDRLVKKATTRDRDRRFRSAPEFLGAVRAIAGRLPAPGPFQRRTAVITPPAETTALGAAGPPPAREREPFPPAPPIVATPAAPLPPGEPPSERSRRRAWRVGIVTTVVLVAIAALSGWFVANGNPFDRTDVPQVVGDSEAQAVAELQSAGFTAEITDRQFSEEVAAGLVIASDPAPGASAQTGATIGLVLSMGPERYEVPKVRGKSPQEASERLTATNLAVAGEQPVFHDDVAEGLVVRTAPAAGQRVKRDTPVELIVSKGPAPVEMPDLAGLTLAQARAKLSEAGLDPEVTREESTTTPADAIISFSPKAGTMLHRGDAVALVVSEGPPPVTVPSVVDLPKDEAVAELERLGFDVRVSEGIVTPLGRVYAQDPAPGAVVPAGSTVTISVF